MAKESLELASTLSDISLLTVVEQSSKFTVTERESHFKNNGQVRKQTKEVACSHVHAVSGRVRFRLPRLINDTAYAQRLQALLSADSLVTNIRIKPVDKTGTLTRGEVAVVKVDSFNSEITPQRILQLAATAEKRLTHPAAEAVMRYAEEQKIETLSREQWEYQLGLGVKAEIEGQTVYVGSDRFMRHLGLDPSDAGQQPASAIYVAVNDALQGSIEYSDLLRPESQKTIATLIDEEGIEVHMLTGDNWRTAKSVATQLGIHQSHTHAEAFPSQKAKVVGSLHETGKTVAFVGDGINDSPALAYADVSVSFANGSDIARETADVVLMQNDLHGLLEAIEIARLTKHLVQQSTNIVALPNLGALLIAVLFGLNPLAATVVNNGSTVVAGVNGLRPLLKPTQKAIAKS